MDCRLLTHNENGCLSALHFEDGLRKEEDSRRDYGFTADEAGDMPIYGAYDTLSHGFRSRF